MVAFVAFIVVTLSSVVLFGFGLNLIYLGWLRTSPTRPVPSPLMLGEEPAVCVQIPVYNERYVAGRVIDAVAAIEWPRDRFEIQVIDDSDDETTEIVLERASHWRRLNVVVTHVRRASREGFKAGALAEGLALTRAPFIAIFDADFVPAPDFLRRVMHAFDDPAVGFVQARWGYLNERYSWFTRLQAVASDFHFLVEQAVRPAHGFFTNFSGTAGVWRRETIEDSGGWTSATLTEDLDLSYRAQLRGWRAAYCEDVVVPQELPVSINAYRRQQSRWATGSFQVAFRLLGRVLRSNAKPTVKLQACIHLLAYGVGPLWLIQLASFPIFLAAIGVDGPRAIPQWVPLWVNLIFLSPWFGFTVAQMRRGRPIWSGGWALLCQVLGAGTALTVALALFNATKPGGEFVRTPKHRIVRAGEEWRDKAYVKAGDLMAVAEAAMGIAALLIAVFAIWLRQPLMAAYSSIFAAGFMTISLFSLLEFIEVLTLRGSGRRALGRLRAAIPGFVLFAMCGAALLLAAQQPEPFEDGYQHWLMAANLAQTGDLRDPLFSMQDTWLPAYQVLAAAFLKVFGLWNFDVLKSINALFGLATLAFVYRLAANARQGAVAVALLALNPVFLFTSGSAVAEPMLTASLFGAGLAAVRGRTKLAAALGLVACLTGTKAWIWIVALVAVVVLERLVASRGQLVSRRPAVAWTAPALAAVVLLQLAFAPAAHSLARGSIEAASAGARGSIPTDALHRLLELASTYGIAALPLVALAPIGLWFAWRSRVQSETAALLRFIYVPGLIYLGAVFVLVTDGSYSGSHRYLYPALPALALLGAAALDRHRALPTFAALAASSALCAGFLPVFVGFAQDNAGLVAAGAVAAAQPGSLLTDSPVVAYTSGKPPSAIYGSEVLPADRDQAISWIREHGIGTLVLEDISYYRATAVFSDLAAGTPEPPFEPIGDQAGFNVPGGKPVGVFRVGDARKSQNLFGNVAVAIDPQPRAGKSAPLAKGLALTVEGIGATGEGMGFGVPIVDYPDGWVFPRTATTVDESTSTASVWKRSFQLDETGGDASPSTAHYFQFDPIASRGEIDVTYTIVGSRVLIDVRVINLAPGYTEVAILNEQSAAFSDLADESHTLLGSAFGSWVPVNGSWARLRSSSLGVEWSMPAIGGSVMYGGRELASPDFDWAGLDYTFAGPFTGADYTIEVQKAR